MDLENRMGGRRERRLPIIVVVRLTPLQQPTAELSERTHTDNVSAHGARVISTRLWRPGEQAEVTPVSQDAPLRGEVVYCQKLDENRFFVGLKFPQNRVPWATVQRFDGF